MASTDDEIIVQLTMQAAQFQAAAQEAGVTTEGLAAQINAANVDILAQGAALTRLDSAFAAPITTAKQLAAAESALDEAMRTGAISAEQQAAYLDKLSASQAAVAETAQLATAGTEELTAAQTISGGVAREVGVLIGELARGNYHRLEGSTITLANRTGLLAQVFSPMGVAIMAAAGTVLFLGDQLLKAEEIANAFNRSILATGDIVGMTSGELNGLAMQIGVFTGDTAQADELVQKLAQSGKLSGQALQYAAQAAANSMQLTGESAEQAAHEVEALGENPTKAVVALNDKYHFLTVELYEQISALQRDGDAFGAAELAAKAFADSTSDRLDQLNSKMGFFERQISDFKAGFNVIDQGLRKAFDPTLEEQSAEATHKAVQAQYELQQVKDAAEEKQRANENAFRNSTETAQQYLANEKAIDNDLLAAYAAYIAKKRELDAGDTKALQADARLWQTYVHAVNDDVTRSMQLAAEKTQRTWDQAASQFTHAMVNGFNQIVFAGNRTHMSLAQMAAQTGAQITESMVDQVLEQWIGAEAKKLAASLQTLIGVGTANATQAATDIATDKAKTSALVIDAVAVAGAQGVASFSGAPWPVDMGAPAFGAAMAAAAGGFGAVASAAGGWERVPHDDAPALLHRNEMVLPATLADRVRGMTEPGGGATHNWNFSMVDGRSVTQLLRSDPHGLMKAAKRAVRVSKNR
jgi:phage-related minor tail protein